MHQKLQTRRTTGSESTHLVQSSRSGVTTPNSCQRSSAMLRIRFSKLILNYKGSTAEGRSRWGRYHAMSMLAGRLTWQEEGWIGLDKTKRDGKVGKRGTYARVREAVRTRTDTMRVMRRSDEIPSLQLVATSIGNGYGQE